MLCAVALTSVISTWLNKHNMVDFTQSWKEAELSSARAPTQTATVRKRRKGGPKSR